MAKRDSCFVYYLDKTPFVNDDLSWKQIYAESKNLYREKTWPSEYCLKDVSDIGLMRVECFDEFKQKERLMEAILILSRIVRGQF